MRNLFGYFNVQLARETHHYLRQNAIRISRSITDFSNGNLEVCDKQMNLFNKVNQKLNEIFAKLQNEEDAVIRGEIDVV